MSTKTTEQKLRDNQQNYFIAMATDRAEKVITWLIENELTILDIQIGRFQQPVIKVQHNAQSNKLESFSHFVLHRTGENWVTKRAKILHCIVEWEQPLSPTLTSIH